MSIKKTYKDYNEYLKSPKWKAVKKNYAKNEQTEKCLCCGIPFKYVDTSPNYHHFKYPKNWDNDSWENLIIVCDKCHVRLHRDANHGSDPLSLRCYIITLLSVANDLIESVLKDANYDSIWCDSAGNFSITQYGMSNRKHMDVRFKTQDQDLIEYFESMRDE